MSGQQRADKVAVNGAAEVDGVAEVNGAAGVNGAAEVDGVAEGSHKGDTTGSGPSEQVERRDAVWSEDPGADEVADRTAVKTASPAPLYLRTIKHRTWQRAGWTAEELIAAKRGRTVSVVLPALNEEDTVGAVVTAVRAAGALVDEIVVLDGGCTDRTAERARAAGAVVIDRETALPGVELRPGKGEVLWRSLAATSGDLIVFVDADLVDVGPEMVVGLLGPLLTVDGVALVKGFYRRPLRIGSSEQGTGGGRVTELMARPLLARFAPWLSGIIQPLGGEYAGTRDLLESLPFAGGYGVEIGLLLDTAASRGLDAIGQVDLGVRKHRNRNLTDLGAMAQEVLATVLHRSGVDPEPRPVDLVQYQHQPGAHRADGAVAVHDTWQPVVRRVARTDRPPIRSVMQPAVRGTILS